MWTGPGETCEIGQPVEREVHLSRRATVPVAAHVGGEFTRKMLEPGQPLERLPRIEARRHDGRFELIAVLERDAVRAATRNENPVDTGVGANLDACFPRSGRKAVRDAAGSTSRQTPRAERAVDLAHVVVKQDVRGAG